MTSLTGAFFFFVPTEERHARRSADWPRVRGPAGRRGSIAAHLLIWVAAVTGATAAVALQAPPANAESWIVPGLVVTLLLLLLGKMVSNERTIGKLEGALTENSKRDDGQERAIAELWVEARGIEGRLKETRQEAIDACKDAIGTLEERTDHELDDLQERVRELERGGTRGPPARAT